MDCFIHFLTYMLTVYEHLLYFKNLFCFYVLTLLLLSSVSTGLYDTYATRGDNKLPPLHVKKVSQRINTIPSFHVKNHTISKPLLQRRPYHFSSIVCNIKYPILQAHLSSGGSLLLSAQMIRQQQAYYNMFS